MRFKLVVAFIDEQYTHKVLDDARKAGATGATVINNAMGEGLEKHTTFLGLTMGAQRDIVFMIVEEHLSRDVLEAVGVAGEFGEEGGKGVAFQLDIEDVVGMNKHIKTLTDKIEHKL
jgi:nitrogen regulatory protein PII